MSDAQLRALLKQLGELGEEPDNQVASEIVKKALRVPIPMVRARAAKAARDARLEGLTDALVAAYDQAFQDPWKQDPGCHIKLAALEALDFSDHEDAELFLRGIAYRQEESSFDGGRVDTAGGLRARCGFALVRLHHQDTLTHLADLLVDPLSVVRESAAQALAYHGDPLGAALLRLRLHYPEPDPDVVIEYLKAYLELDAEHALPLAERCLASDNDTQRCGAALALGESRQAAALPLLRRHVEALSDQRELRVGLMSIATLRLDEGNAYLLELVPSSDPGRALGALEALLPFAREESVRSALLEATSQHPDPQIRAAGREALAE